MYTLQIWMTWKEKWSVERQKVKDWILYPYDMLPLPSISNQVMEVGGGQSLVKPNSQITIGTVLCLIKTGYRVLITTHLISLYPWCFGVFNHIWEWDAQLYGSIQRQILSDNPETHQDLSVCKAGFETFLSGTGHTHGVCLSPSSMHLSLSKGCGGATCA